MTISLYSNDLSSDPSSSHGEDRMSSLMLSTRTTPQVFLTYYEQSLSEIRLENDDLNCHSQATSHQLQDERYYRKFAKVFFFISLVSATSTIIFECYMYAIFKIHNLAPSDEELIEVSIYLALYIFAGVYQMLITIMALNSTNLILLLCLMWFYCCILLYTGIQYQELHKPNAILIKSNWTSIVLGLNISTICVIGLSLISQSVILYYGLRKYINWYVFKKIGANLKLKWLYNVFQTHYSILMLDFFFFIGFTIQFVIIMINDRKSTEFILTIIVLPLTPLVLISSDISSSREWLYCSITTLCLFVCALVYVLFKLIRLYSTSTSAYDIAILPGEYFLGRNSLLTFGIITSVSLSTTIVLEVLVIFNYKKGLLDFVNSRYKMIPGFKDSQLHNIDIYDDEIINVVSKDDMK